MDQLEQKRQLLNRVVVAESPAEPLTVAHIMTRKPICIDVDLSAYELVQLFHAKRFRHLLVVDRQGKLAGVISDRDVLRCFGFDSAPSREQLSTITAERLMSTDVITIDSQMALSEAVTTMLTHGINCLPIVDGGKLVGIITSTDLYLVLERLLHAPATCQVAAQVGPAAP